MNDSNDNTPDAAAENETAAPSTEIEGNRIEENKDARTWGMLAHLSALAGYVIPFGNIIGPLIVWLIKKEEYPFVDDQGKESLNFQISFSIYMFIAVISLYACVGFILVPALAIAGIVFIVLGTIKANNGEYYRYPLTIRLIK